MHVINLFSTILSMHLQHPADKMMDSIRINRRSITNIIQRAPAKTALTEGGCRLPALTCMIGQMNIQHMLSFVHYCMKIQVGLDQVSGHNYQAHPTMQQSTNGRIKLVGWGIKGAL